MFLTDLSIKRPVFITVIIIACLAVGLVSYFGLPINQYPATDSPMATVSINLRGTSPDQMEAKVTKKVEDAIGQLSGVKHISSTVTEGYSQTSIEFEFGKDADIAVQEVKDKISSIRGTLPQDIDEPVIQKMDMDAQPIISLVVTGPLSNLDLSTLVEDDITKRMTTVSGVGSVTTYGAQEREIRIALDKDKLASFGLAPSQVVAGLQNDNTDMSSGKLSNSENEISLRTNSKVKEVNDFLDLLVANRAGKEIRIRDIAQVEDGIKDRQSVSYYKGQETIGIDIVKQSGENTTQVADDIKQEIASIQASLPSSVKIEVVDDNSQSIRESVNDVKKTLIEGCVLAVVIVFIFLGNWGSTAISALSLPTSIITTFAVIKVMGFTLNMMSLMALSLAVGLLVDDAIVVIENIIRHLHMGKTPFQAARDGTNEIGLAVMATTFTIVAVFLPIAMVDGMIGQFFKQFGITVAASVLVSLFVSFTLVPMLTSRYMKKEEEGGDGILGKFSSWFNHLFDQLARFYTNILAVALNKRRITLIIASAMFFSCLTLIPMLKTSFMDASDDGKITVEANLGGSTTIDSAEKTAKSMEAALKKYPEIRYIYTTVTAGKINMTIKLPDKKERTEAITATGAKMRQDLNKIPGIELSVSAGAGIGSGKDAQFRFVGTDFSQVLENTLKAQKVLRSILGAVDVSIDYQAGTAEAKLDVDRDRAADLGVDPATIANTLSTLFNGSVATYYETEKNRYDVRVLLTEDQRTNFDSLKGIYVANSTGGLVPLSQVTKTTFATSSTTIKRYDKQRQITLSANYTGTGNLNSLFNQKFAQEVKLPSGVKQVLAGMEANQTDMVTQLLTAFFMGILFIFLILAAQFESFIDPLAILFSLPFAIIGAILALFIGNKSLGLMAGIGVIMLMGLVTKNAILLIDFTKQQRGLGVDRRQAILQAGSTRLRPIMMTTMAMIFGMLPSAVATGSGSESRVPMAYAIIGGLISSTILTLVVVPVVYTLLDDLKGWLSSKISGKKSDTVVAEKL